MKINNMQLYCEKCHVLGTLLMDILSTDIGERTKNRATYLLHSIYRGPEKLYEMHAFSCASDIGRRFPEIFNIYWEIHCMIYHRGE